MKNDLTAAQKVLAENLNDALLQVARLAQELSDTSGTTSDGTYLVDGPTMTELKQAVDTWSTATQQFLSSLSVVSQDLPDPSDPGTHFAREPGE